MDLPLSLNAPALQDRLDAARALRESSPQPPKTHYVNNHIHTTYSFSPYSPSMAVCMAWKNGLQTAGIMDHDSISGAREFLEAGAIFGLKTTIGVECRIRAPGTLLWGRRTNNPDQQTATYAALHGIPHTKIDTVDAFFAPLRLRRIERDRKMLERLNRLLAPAEVTVDFDRDVLPASWADKGGSVTERHICWAASQALVAKYGCGQPLLDVLQKIGVPLSEKARMLLSDPENPFLGYDLLGFMKSDLVPRFYIDAEDELPPVGDYIALARETGAIAVYPYLGDVTASVTGDKRAQTFEDGYLDELFPELKRLGFQAVAYMPTRNTPEQLRRLRALCARWDFFEISGEDINSPRQSFLCRQLDDPAFQHLIPSTYALIGHELAATESLSRGMFSPETLRQMPSLRERVAYYSRLAGSPEP